MYVSDEINFGKNVIVCWFRSADYSGQSIASSSTNETGEIASTPASNYKSNEIYL